MKSCFKIYFALVLVLLSFNLKAQNDSTNYNYLKYSVKTNVFQWFMNEPNIAFEYRFSPKFGWENTIGTYFLYYRTIPNNLNSSEPLPQKGITFRSNLKWYYVIDNKYKRDELYISPMLIFKKNVVKGTFGHFSQPSVREENRTIIGASVLCGAQIVRRHFLLDIYFGGGLRYRYLTGTYSRYYGIGDWSEPRDFTKDEWMPSIHLGVKLGYNSRGTPHKPKNKFESPYFKYAFTTNLFSSIFREQNVAYEYRINRNIGLEAIAGAFLIKRSVSYAFDKDLKLQNSYSLYFQPKIYLGSPRNKSEYTFYISPMLMYRKDNFKNNQYYQTLKDEKIGPSLLTGCQFNKRHFVANFYIGGGYHKHYFIKQYELYNAGLQTEKYTDWKLAVQGGVKIGYVFKTIH